MLNKAAQKLECSTTLYLQGPLTFSWPSGCVLAGELVSKAVINICGIYSKRVIVWNIDISGSVQFDWAQTATEQRREFRPNNDGSVCCTAEPLIRVLHAALMTDRGESAGPAGSAHLSAHRLDRRGRWQLAGAGGECGKKLRSCWTPDTSLTPGTSLVQSHSWYRFGPVSPEGEGRRGGG